MLRGTGSISARWLLLAVALGVCFAQAPPAFPTDSAAVVTALAGSVSVLRDSTPWALAEGSPIRPGQLVITGPDGYARFQLSDGSTFEVFPNSKVVFRNNPGNWKDLLDLVLGRIKVQIQKLGGQPNYNRVHTPTAIISVRGTIFDVTVDDGDSTLVVVEEGQVEVAHRRIPGSKLLNAGEWLRISKDEPLARKVEKGSVIKAVLRAASDAIYVILTNPGPTSRGGGSSTSGGSSSGGSLPGDNGSTTPTPTPPSSGGTTPPAPPAPPSGGTTAPPAPPPG
jgi:hypothetical protein